LGGADEIDRVLAQTNPDAVLVTIPNAARDRLDPIVSACARAGIDCRFVRRELDLAPGAVLGSTAE
jgi:FlaA1/EpsC-like NDP-sugar epimerase